jgi:hypothetical protein
LSERTYIASSAQQSDQRALYNILVDTNTPYRVLATDRLALDVRSSLDAASLTDSVLLVVVDIELNVDLLKSGNHTGNGTVAPATQLELLAIHQNDTLENTDKVLGVLSSALSSRCRRARSVGCDAVVDQLEVGVLAEEVCSLKQRSNLRGQQLAPNLLTVLLNNLGEGDLETTGKVELEFGVDDESASSLSGLGVDTNDSLVVSANIAGIQRQIRHAIPGVLVAVSLVLAVLESLLDSILVAAGEGSANQATAVRSTLVDGDLSARLDHVDN